MPKRVLIIGVAGFIGSHLLEKIIHERTEWNVIGVDMVAPDKIQQLLGAEKKWAARFEFHQMNIVTAGLELKALIARSDVVINLAAICNPSEYIKQPVNTINSNFTDAQDCIQYCVDLDKHLVHFSTCEVYGRTLASYGLPKDDPQNYVLDEETTPMIMGPVSAQRWCYACAKQLVERLIYAHGTENNLKFTIVRPYNWIGPRMDYIPGVDGKDDGQPRVLASFMTALMKGDPLVLVNGGEVAAQHTKHTSARCPCLCSLTPSNVAPSRRVSAQVFRTFCFVDDAIECVCRIVERPDKSIGHAFNVGNPGNNIQVGCCAEHAPCTQCLLLLILLDPSVSRLPLPLASRRSSSLLH
jgi:UDP-apiose/xylose synthase